MPSISAQLGTKLGPTGQILAGREWSRLRQQNNTAEDDLSENIEKEESVSRAGQLRQAVKDSREKEQAVATTGVTDKAAQMGSVWLLRAAWINIITSFGLTLIYINIHVFLRFVLGEKFFCKLGSEWLANKAPVPGADLAGQGMGMVEIMLLLILDIILFVIIAIFLTMVIMIINFLSMGWWEQLLVGVRAMWSLGWNGLSALATLFGGGL